MRVYVRWCCFVVWMTVVLLCGRTQPAWSLPFTLGSPVPLQIERVDRGGKDYSILTFTRETASRPTVLFGNASFIADTVTYDEYLNKQWDSNIEVVHLL